MKQGQELKSGFKFGGVFEVTCHDKDGNLKWTDKAHNLWVQEGLEYLLDVIFKAGTRQDPLYVGLIKTTLPGTDSSMNDNGTGWYEADEYDETTRQEFVDGAITGTTTKQLDNDASKASFTMNASVTLKGAFLATDNTKGGTTGKLLCAVAFTEGDRSVLDNDVVNVKYTVGSTDDGA
ncbi:MAG: hypothetical protein ACXQTR_02530 [Candidatus Methanospirareceae archaeon]